MASVSLPKLPEGKEFEEYISAFFQCDGCYIERNIIEREVQEVLELDIITTDHRKTPPQITLLEVKSKGWGFADLFKVRGWMDYTGIEKGLFIAGEERQYMEFWQAKAKKLGIDLVAVPDLSKTREALSESVDSEAIGHADLLTWRFSYWVERNLLRRLNRKKKSHPEVRRFKALEEYYYEVSSGIFFTENIIDRLQQLYSAFQKNPRISAKCGNEVIGNPFEEEHESVPQELFQETYYKCRYNDIQISAFVEHRARLAILKNAVDYQLYKEAGVGSKTESVQKILGVKFDRLDLLPPSFKRGLQSISQDKYFHKYPVFWQWFMWVFGGFILKDYEEREYEVLSQRTGIPVDEIPHALHSYEKLFPCEGGWFNDLSPASRITTLNMFSAPFMGIGANYRRLLYTDTSNLKELKVSGMHTLRDLIKWNNLTIEVLEKTP